MKILNPLILAGLAISSAFYQGSVNADSTSCSTSSANCATECASSKLNSGSKSSFRLRSVIEDVSLYNALNYYKIYGECFGASELGQKEDDHIFLTRGIFVQQSVRNKNNKPACYFLPGNKKSAAVREDGSGDIGSLWLKVIAPVGQLYSSTISLCPQTTKVGSYFDYHQNFKCIKNLWLDVKFAVYQTTNKLNPKEVLANNTVQGTLPGAATALEYLGSDELKYGKISKCKLERVAFDDIEVKLGYNLMCNGCSQLGFYGSMLIPISPKPSAEFLFDAQVGRSHWGLGLGLNGLYKAIDKENRTLALMLDASYQYLFARTEKRSLDLTANGEWSRYLRVVQKSAPGISFPAINFFTQNIKVEPRGVFNLWIAAHYQHCDWHFEGGYNLWARQSEKLCFKNKCTQDSIDACNIGIFDIANTCQLTTSSTTNISQSRTIGNTGSNNAVSDATFVTIKQTDLNLASASHPPVLTNKFYAALSYDLTVWCRPINVGLGASYELSRDRNAFSQWGAWLNLETGF